jgi:DNA repair exonuclease SbcCD nuclease subunit
MTSENLLSRAPLVISGHFHTRQEREYSTGKIVYLGSPYHMDFGDSGPRGFTILDIENNQMDFVQNDVSPVHIKVSLSEVKNDSVVLNKKLVKNNFIKIIVDTNYEPEEVEELIKTVNTASPNNLTIDYKYNTAVQKIVSDVDFASVDVADAIKEFINKLDIENKKSIIDYTLELYQKSK